MPTSTTNTYEISLRLVDNTPFAVTVSDDNRCQVKPPVLMRGVPAILRIKLFKAGGLVKAAELSALYTGFRLVIANDFDDTTAPLLVSDENGATVDAQNDCIVLPISEMNTLNLEALIGTRERLDLGAELQLFKPALQDEPIEAWQFPVGVQNRRDLTGTATPAPGSVNYYSKDETYSKTEVNTAIANAKNDGVTSVTTLSGASATVEPGKVYSLNMSADFELSASAVNGYGESVLFVTPGSYAFSVASGITLDAEMTSGNNYRLLISWTPYGVHVEQTAEWEAGNA